MTSSSKLPGLMNSNTYRPNGGPHGVLGAVGQRRIPARETPDNARGVVTPKRAMSDYATNPEAWKADARDALRGIASMHRCVNRDYTEKTIAGLIELACEDGRTPDLNDISQQLIRQITANKEGAKMDTQQQSLPEPKPTGKGPFGKPVSEIPQTTLRCEQTPQERAADLDATLGPDTTPAPVPSMGDSPWWQDPDTLKALRERLATNHITWDEARLANGLKQGDLMTAFTGTSYEFFDAAIAATQKPTEKAPQSDATPAPVADAPAPRSDATAAQVAAIAGKPEPTPEPAIVTPATPRYEEWPFVALLTMYSPEGLEMKYTLRAASDAQLLDAERAFVARRLAAGYTTTRQPVTPLPVATPVTPSAPALPTRDAAPVTYAPLPETVATPAAGGTADSKGRTPGQTGTDRIVGITRNEVNRKVTYDLWMATGNYAEHTLRIDEDVARLQAALPTVNLQAMTAGSRYPVALDVTWVVTGKMNGKGTYYHRNVTAIVAVA